jgi:2-isopropylmalate synthase
MKIFDTTLRDGEGGANVSFSLEDKIYLAQCLEKLGVDVIEAGFPIASKRDFKSVQEIGHFTQDVKLAVFARDIKVDIDQAREALEDHIHRSRLSTFTNAHELFVDLTDRAKARQLVLQRAREAIDYGRGLFPEVQFYLTYAGNRDPMFLVELAVLAANSGATQISIADTQSTLEPVRITELVRIIRSELPFEAELSIHCHNQIGLGLANTIAALDAGANQAEVTVGNLGDGGGNTAIEQVVAFANFIRKNKAPFDNKIAFENIYCLAQAVQKASGFKYGTNQPLVGDTCFHMETGIHHELLRKIPESTFNPELCGRRLEVSISRLSGIVGLQEKLKELGCDKNVNIAKLHRIIKEKGVDTLSSDELLNLVNNL